MALAWTARAGARKLALALAAGKRAPTYGQAMARVRKALYAHAAAGKALPAIDELLRMIIGPGPSRRSR